MTKYILCLFILAMPFCFFGQGIRSGDIEFAIVGIDPLRVNFVIETFTEDFRPGIVVDWGDGTTETIFGTVFPKPNYFYNEYAGQHIYQDTGIYEITYQDNYWVKGIENVPNSATQPFILKARVWLTSEVGFSYNHSVWLSTTSDHIKQHESGVIVHQTAYVDWDGDDVIQKLIPVPTPGYFLPEATDSLTCCLVWDKPMETGRYAFGMEFEDWREGKWRGTIQRFILVDVDSLPVTQYNESFLSEMKLVLSPNPANSTLTISTQLPSGTATLTLTALNLLGQPVWQQARPAAGGEIQETVDVSNWPPGVYFITLEAGGSVPQGIKLTEKVVVAR